MSEFHGKQRRFQVYIAVSCSGPDVAATRTNSFGTRRSRDGADLRFTTADCDWWHQHFRQPHYDSSDFEQHYRLVNPSRAEILEALLGPVDVHREAMIAAARLMVARKLPSVLS